MSDVEMAYCVPCGFLNRAVDLAETLLSPFGADIDSVSLVTGDHGVFEVRVDGASSTGRKTRPTRRPSSEIGDFRLPIGRGPTTALNIGANGLVACTTTVGQQHLYEGCESFRKFRETTREIARLQPETRRRAAQ